MALAVMVVGATALVGLQQLTTRANTTSREMSTATQIMQTWLERLKLDALQWNAANVLTNTDYLQTVDGTWIVPSVVGTQSPAFDHWGRDLAPIVDANTRFCMSYRLTWVFSGEAMRADVRVYWPRKAQGAHLATDFASCGPSAQANLAPGTATAARYHVIYASDVLRWTPLRTL